MSRENILAIDIGGTNIKYGIVTDDYEIINRGQVPSPKTYEQLLELLSNIYSQYQDEVSNKIGISCPAKYDGEKIFGTSYLKYIIGKDIPTDLSAKTNSKVYIENDGNCAILGEYLVSEEKYSSMAVFVIGSGIGGGIIIDGNLVKGANGIGGELGLVLPDVVVTKNTKKKTFGSNAGMSSFIKAAQLKNCNVKNGFDIYNNKKELYYVIKKECRYIAMQAINLQYIIDPEQIYIGGAISSNNEFIETINREILNYGKNLPIHFVLPRVIPLTRGNDSNLLGAAYLAMNNKYKTNGITIKN